jgi:hypothetical protein
MISFAPHPSEQQINQHKKNLKILAHYKKCYPDLYTKVGRFLHPGKTIEMGSEEEVYWRRGRKWEWYGDLGRNNQIKVWKMDEYEGFWISDGEGSGGSGIEGWDGFGYGDGDRGWYGDGYGDGCESGDGDGDGYGDGDGDGNGWSFAVSEYQYRGLKNGWIRRILGR